MNKTTFVRARIAPNLKNEAEHVLDELGISPSQAINMLYKHIIREHGWPMDLKIPNELTRKTIEEADQGKNIVECEDAEDMFKKLGI